MKKRIKSSDEETIERLEKEVRELKSLNRNLLKRIKKLDRGFKYSEATEEAAMEEAASTVAPVVKTREHCPRPNCEGFLENHELKAVNKVYRKCTRCDYRTKTQKI